MDFVSDPANPVKGTGKLDFHRPGPSVTVGWGNLLPHIAKRFTVPFEAGVVYQGAPKATLSLSGNVCGAALTNCRTVSAPPFRATSSPNKPRLTTTSTSFRLIPSSRLVSD
jgi:hypothetical protein